MKSSVYYLILILLIIYIISPWDLHPHFIDDLIAFGVLWYLWLKKKKQWGQRSNYYSSSQAQRNGRARTDSSLGLEDAYRLMGTTPNASWEEAQKAYKEKVAKSHPDKVAHLSEELQNKAKELTLQLNKAIDVIRQHKKA